MSTIPPATPTPASGTVTVTKFQRAKGWFVKRNLAVKILLGFLLLAILLACLGGIIALCFVIVSWAFTQTVALFSNDTEPTARPTYVASEPAPTPSVPDPTATAA